MSNVIFMNNKAPSGPDISSYPVKVVLTGTNSSFINLTNVASGQTQDINLRFSVVDYDNQLSSTTSGGRITISPSAKNTSVLGLTSASIVNGSATFTSLILVANPGLTNVPFKISSNAIDSSKLLKQFGTSSIQDPMVVSFRFCKPGEYFDSQQCKVCGPGTFSLDWNSTDCYTCPSNANCLGGVQIYVNSGYWRSSTNSTYMSECPRQNSCLGQYHPENQYPVACDSGYSGILCTDCTVIDGEQYERQSNFECAKCPILVYNILRIMGLILLVSIFFIILIIVNIRKKKESQQSILMRILANYVQLLSVSMSFNMKFPPILVQIFYPLQKIGASSEAFLSLDCFFRDASIKGFTPSTAMFKVFLTGILPLFLIIVAAIVWVILYATFKKWFKDLKRNLIVTIIVIIYLLHPTITKVSFEIFQCIRVDESEYRAKLDLSIKCFSFEHMKWGLILGFPMIIIWAIGCPVSVAIILFKNRKNLSEARIQKYLLILYQGLQEKCFYWELVNTGRKISMVAINVFLSTMPLLYSSTTAVILLVILIRVQIKLKPYKDELNNELEIESMITGTATLFCGVLFTSDDNRYAIIVLVVLIVLILINIKFLLHWCFCISFTFIGKYKLCHSIFNILGTMLFKKNLAEKMINNADIEQMAAKIKDDITPPDKKKKKSRKPKNIKKKRIFGGHRRKDNKLDLNNMRVFNRDKEKYFNKLPEESKTSSEFSRIKSILEETAINESDKGLKNVQKSSNSDSIDYSDIIKYKGCLKNNKRTVEMTPNLSNSKEVNKSFKLSTFAVKQNSEYFKHAKDDKLNGFPIIEIAIVESSGELDSY